MSYEDATQRLSSERDELQRQHTSLQRRQAQVQHELKRKDHEYERLQDRSASYYNAPARYRWIFSTRLFRGAA